MGYKVFSFEYWLQQYRAAGFNVIPIEGKYEVDGTWNEKAAGFKGWETFVAPDADLLRHIQYKFRWGVVCGPISRNLLVLDYDLQKEFGGDYEAARRWRELHKWALRDMDTLVDFTPSGGCHVFFYAPNGLPDATKIDRITYGVFPCSPDLIKFAGQVLIPPSRLISKGPMGYYRFLDQDDVLPNLIQNIRVLK